MTRLKQIERLISGFFTEAEATNLSFFNEAELQHELGYWLRRRDSLTVYFERPVESFLKPCKTLTKKEIDLVVTDSIGESLYAIELKCPRNGRVPETMFDACRDLRFLEELVRDGFSGGLFLLHVNAESYWKAGDCNGIYSHFRTGKPLCSSITKPTGARNEVVQLSGCYKVSWRRSRGNERYWLQVVSPRKAGATRRSSLI